MIFFIKVAHRVSDIDLYLQVYNHWAIQLFGLLHFDSVEELLFPIKDYIREEISLATPDIEGSFLDRYLANRQVAKKDSRYKHKA
jgi:hypothetical protein